jgi:hypothetical protein
VPHRERQTENTSDRQTDRQTETERERERETRRAEAAYQRGQQPIVGVAQAQLAESYVATSVATQSASHLVPGLVVGGGRRTLREAPCWRGGRGGRAKKNKVSVHLFKCFMSLLDTPDDC